VIQDDIPIGRREARRAGVGRLLPIAIVVAFVSGCSSINSTANLEPASQQTLEYYPGLVKGFEHTFPRRQIVVLAVNDACESRSPGAAQSSGEGQEIGLTVDTNGQTIQRLYATGVAAIVQKALVQAADEAGMIATASTEATYTAQPVDADYVLQTKVVKCWVKKQRVVDSDKNASWQTMAEFALDAAIYKPPFHIPFWQGSSSETYSDPPDNPGVMSEDQASIYDEPGQVLSVAFTRAVEGIFKRGDLRALVTQDRALRH
jgi:hypothetical protein